MNETDNQNISPASNQPVPPTPQNPAPPVSIQPGMPVNNDQAAQVANGPSTPPPTPVKNTKSKQYAAFAVSVLAFISSIFIVGFIFGVIALVISYGLLKEDKKLLIPKIASVIAVLAMLISVWSALSVGKIYNDVSDNGTTTIENIETTDEQRAEAQNTELVPFSSSNQKDKKSVVFDVPKGWESSNNETLTTGGVHRFYDVARSSSSDNVYLLNSLAYAYNIAAISDTEFTQQELDDFTKTLLNNPDSTANIENIKQMGELTDVKIIEANEYNGVNLTGAELLIEAKLTVDSSPIYGKYIVAKTPMNIQIMFLFISSGADEWAQNQPLFDRIIDTIKFYE